MRAFFLVTKKTFLFPRESETGLSSTGAVGHDLRLHVLAPRAVAELALDAVFRPECRVSFPIL
jgi:hypothetical protein